MSVLALFRQAPSVPLIDDKGSSDFRGLVEGGWDKVHPDIRARMDRLLTSPNETVFKGKGCVRRSLIGLIFAHLSRVFGAPLVWKEGADVTTIVRIVPKSNGYRCWHRQFCFPDGTKYAVKTTKLATANAGMLDAVGENGKGMLATKMRIWADGPSLCFESLGYILRFGKYSIPIPSILTPGRLYAEHRDQGDGVFRYILAFSHPFWGETFYQNGLFRMEDG